MTGSFAKTRYAEAPGSSRGTVCLALVNPWADREVSTNNTTTRAPRISTFPVFCTTAMTRTCRVAAMIDSDPEGGI